MSFLIGARGKDFVVVIADGYSLRVTAEDTSVERTDAPKIFKLGELPCVVAHHGQNELGQVRVESVFKSDGFQRMHTRSWNRGLNVAMGRTIERLDSVVSQTLKSSKHRGIFGMWFAGFWPCSGMPEITELVWSQRSANAVRIAVQPFGNLVVGGSGLEYLREFFKKPVDEEYDARELWNKPVEYSMELVKRLYAVAIKKQKAEGKMNFGGTRTMAVITRDGVDLGPLD